MNRLWRVLDPSTYIVYYVHVHVHLTGAVGGVTQTLTMSSPAAGTPSLTTASSVTPSAIVDSGPSQPGGMVATATAVTTEGRQEMQVYAEQ